MRLSLTTLNIALATALVGAALHVQAQAQTTQNVPPRPANEDATTPRTPAGPTTSAPSANTPSAMDATGAATDAERDSALADEDETFLENAIQGSYAEIEGSQLALDKTESQDVRQFADMMIKDHGQMVKEATKLATEKGMTPPEGPSAMQTTEITALKALTGGAFDAMYVNRIGVASHEATVEMFEEATKEAQDPDVKAMAEKTLPKLREHLEAARRLNEKQEKQ